MVSAVLVPPNAPVEAQTLRWGWEHVQRGLYGVDSNDILTYGAYTTISLYVDDVGCSRG